MPLRPGATRLGIILPDTVVGSVSVSVNARLRSQRIDLEIRTWSELTRCPERTWEFAVPPRDWTSDDAQTLSSLSGLSVVQLLSAGYEHMVAYVPNDVTLCNARGVHDRSVAEWALGALITVFRGLDSYDADRRARRWQPSTGRTLHGKRVLILGYGSIGQELERHLAPFHVDVVRVAANARHGVHTVNELHEFLPTVDAVVALLPKDDSTNGFIDAHFLALLPDAAVVVNAGRGSVLDEQALASELGSGRLYAALDVTSVEPLPAEHELWAANHLFLTPHIGGDTDTRETRSVTLIEEQVARYINGEPLVNVVRTTRDRR